MKIKISSDSTADLSRELIEEYDIGITPLYIIMDGKDYRDTVDISREDIFDHVKKGGDICGTSAVSIQDYINYWTQWKKDADAIVHIAFSSELSASCNNARVAAQEVGDVYIVDSQNLSTGCGHLVLDAAIMARQGMEPQAIVDELERLVPKLNVSFVLDTLDFMAKGGRCSSLVAKSASLLGLKPCIEVRNGKMGVGKKYRGKIEKVYGKYITERLENRDDIDTRRIFITYPSVPDEAILPELDKLILSLQPFEQIYHTNANCTVSNHCGPNCLGILYYMK